MRYTWYEFGLLIVVVSFIGFVVENVWLSFTKGYIDNRNMNLPFLLGYGLACVAVYLLIGTPSEMMLLGRFPVRVTRRRKIVLYFLCLMFLISVGEILLGKITEKLCHIEYWNYTAIPLHITKYTSIPTSTGFASAATLFMGRYFSPLMETFRSLNKSYASIAAAAFLICLTADFLYCYGKMLKTQDYYIKWQIVLPVKHRRKLREGI